MQIAEYSKVRDAGEFYACLRGEEEVLMYKSKPQFISGIINIIFSRNFINLVSLFFIKLKLE